MSEGDPTTVGCVAGVEGVERVLPEIDLTEFAGPEAAGAALDGQSVEFLVTPYDTAPLSGLELAAIADGQAGIRTAVVGSAVPAHATDVPGVEAVLAPDELDRLPDLVAATADPRREHAVGGRTVDALERIYESGATTDASDERLCEMLAVGCERLGLPYGFITRITDGTQEIVAAVGDHDELAAERTTPLDEAYCEHTIEADGVVGFADVTDADWVGETAFERFGLACYVGGRVEVDGERYGTVCFADRTVRDRSFSREERTFVRLLTHWVRREISRRNQAETAKRQRALLGRTEQLASVGGWEYDPADDTVRWTDGIREIYGVEAGFEPTLEDVNAAYHPEDRDRTVAKFRRALEDGRPYDAETRIVRPDGEVRWIRVRGDTTDDGQVVQGAIRDITDRKAREQELEAYETAVQTAADCIIQLDPDGSVRMINEAGTDLTGYDRDQLVGAHLSTVLIDRDAERFEQRIDAELGSERPGVVSMSVTIVSADGSTVPAESRIALLVEDGELRGTIGVLRDVSDQRAHEHTLTELHDVSRSLLSAEDDRSISRTIARAAEEILDIEAVGVYRFDDEANVLRPEAIPETTRELIGSPPVFGPGQGIAWEVFVAGEPRRYDDVTDADDVHDEDTPIRSELLVPIGDHGVLLCGSTAVGAYSDRTLELADLLAANAEAAYDRMRREQRIRDRDRELRDRNQRLRQLDEINDRVRQIGHELVGTATRDQVQSVVCEGLAEVEGYELVWIGGLGSVDIPATPQYRAGTSRGYLDAVPFDAGASAPEPTVRALHSGEPVVINSVADELHEGDWQREALSRDYRSAASFPLQHEGVPYGTLSVYSNEVDGFGQETTAVLSELAGTVAHALATVEQRQALLSDRAVELSFGLDSQPTVLFTLADSLSGQLAVGRVLPQSAERTLLYGEATGVSSRAFRAVCAESHGVDNLRVLDETGDGLRFELVVTGPCVPTFVADHGGRFDSLSIDGDRAVLSVTFGAGGPVNEFIRLFTDRFPGAELLVRRGRQQLSEPADVPSVELTDRQREALVAAHQAGFYDWPRTSTAEEVAESLDIAGSTFLEHLRRAEAKVVESLLEAPWNPDPS